MARLARYMALYKSYILLLLLLDRYSNGDSQQRTYWSQMRQLARLLDLQASADGDNIVNIVVKGNGNSVVPLDYIRVCITVTPSLPPKPPSIPSLLPSLPQPPSLPPPSLPPRKMLTTVLSLSYKFSHHCILALCVDDTSQSITI